MQLHVGVPTAQHLLKTVKSTLLGLLELYEFKMPANRHEIKHK